MALESRCEEPQASSWSLALVLSLLMGHDRGFCRARLCEVSTVSAWKIPLLPAINKHK